MNSGNKYDELIKRIDEKLKDVNFDKNDLERKKKVLISNEVFSYENIEMVNDMIVDNIIYDNTVYTDTIGLIRSLNLDEALDIIKKIDFNNKSIVILKNKE